MSKKILLVEDEAILAMAKQQELVRYSYTTSHVTSGEEAIELICNQNVPVDLILMDIDLGAGIDGTEAARQILEVRDIPIVFLSSHEEPEIVEMTEKITSYGYVVKSSSITVLDASIKMAFKLYESSIREKEKENELRRNEERLSLAMDAADHGFWDWNIDSGNTYFSPRWYTMLGYEPGELPMEFKTWADLLHPDNKDVIAHIEQHVKNTEPFAEEFQLRCKDGSYKWILGQGKSYELNRSRHPSRVVGIHIDISEKKKTEDCLVESREKYKRLYNYSPFLLLEVDLDSQKIISCNEKLAGSLGLLPEDIEGKSLKEFLPEDVLNRRISFGKQAFEQNKILTFDDERAGKSFQHIYIPVHKNGRRLLHTISTDLTELKSVKNELQKNLLTLQNITDNMFDLVSIFTIDGTVEYTSPSCEKLLGYKPEDIIGRNMFDFVHPDDREKTTGQMQELVDSKSEMTQVLRLRKIDGDYVWVENIGKTQTNEKGEVTGIITSTRSISERVESKKIAEDERIFLNIVLDNITEAIIICNAEGKIIRFNEAARRLHNLPEEFIPAEQWAEYYDLYYSCGKKLLKKEDIPLFRAFKGEDVQNFEIIVAPKDSSRPRILSCNGHQLTDSDGRVAGAVTSMYDITDRKKAEEEIRQALKEKDFLMKELNHRVKNSLIMVSSLISLKAAEKEADLSDIQNQIAAISLIHEKLYQSESVNIINCKEYFADLLHSIFSSFIQKPVRIDEKIEDIGLPSKTASFLGLIISEIATNAIKYGFKDDKEAVFSIRMQKNTESDEYELILSNTGHPFPDNVDAGSTETLGLRLINTLVFQMNGSIKLQKKPVPVFTIRFPITVSS